MSLKEIKRVGIMMLIGILALTGCGSSQQLITDASPKVYFVDQAKGALMSENLGSEFAKLSTEKEKIDYVLAALSKGPQLVAVQTTLSLPIGDFVKRVNQNGRILDIYLDSAYKNLTAQESIAFRVSLVYSLTEMDFIDGVEFYVDDMPLTNANGEVIGTIYPNNVILGAIDPNPSTTIQTIALYFPNDEGRLVKEERDVQLNSNVAVERYVVEEIIKGPTKDGLHAVMPSEAVVKEIETKDGLCYVDLSFDLKAKIFTSDEKKLEMIYAIVDSLTELSKVKKVIFLIDGKKEIEWSENVDLKETFERRNDLIEQTN